jgi:hypothetical protein
MINIAPKGCGSTLCRPSWLYKVEPHPFGAMFIMLYDLEGELDSVKFTYQTMKGPPRWFSVFRAAFAVVEVLDEAGVSRASTISFLPFRCNVYHAL